DDGVIDEYRVALDCGAGTGVWTALMAVHFNRVIAIETDDDKVQYLNGQAAGFDNIHIRRQSLCGGDLSIDDLELGFCGLMRLNLAGGELVALRGAFETIRRCHPVLVVNICGMSSRFGHSDRMIHGHLIAEG